MRKGEKIPEDHIFCPECNRPYGFVRCRVTKEGKNFCLTCGADKERLAAKQVVPTLPLGEPS